ncbi:PqqD family peptide modification chaperone [bacterium]|nr:PqqD family peptide modification chaperone [bacterium]
MFEPLYSFEYPCCRPWIFRIFRSMREKMRTIPRPAKGIVTQEVAEGLLLLRDSGDYLVINRTGAFLWNRLEEAHSLDELASALAELPHAPKKTECRSYAQRFISRLQDAGFLMEKKS